MVSPTTVVLLMDVSALVTLCTSSQARWHTFSFIPVLYIWHTAKHFVHSFHMLIRIQGNEFLFILWYTYNLKYIYAATAGSSVFLAAAERFVF